MGKEKFLEIEHKFIVEKNFKVDAFLKKVRALNPYVEKKLTVTDTYFEHKKKSSVIVRHRLDKEQEQFTIKDKTRDNEIRREINIELPKVQRTNQLDKIKVFLDMLDLKPKGIIEKKIHVFHFPKCEIVFYEGLEKLKKKKVNCIEFEAHGYKSKNEALKIIQNFEEMLGFEAKKRCKKSLYDLLLSKK
jgi:adenylate cyclase class IV